MLSNRQRNQSQAIVALTCLAALALVAVNAAGGCSQGGKRSIAQSAEVTREASGNIAEHLTGITEQAALSSLELQNAVDAGDVGVNCMPVVTTVIERQGVIQEHVGAAEIENAKIVTSASGIVVSLQDVEDKESTLTLFLRTLNKWGTVAIIVAAVGLAAYFGLGMVVRPIMRRLGIAVSPAFDAAAKFDAEAVVSGTLSPMHDKSITAARVDPDYDAAFKKHKRELEKEQPDAAA